MPTPIEFGKSFLVNYYTKRDVKECLAMLSEDVIFITPEEMYHLREQKEVFAFLGGQLPEGGERFYVDVSDVCGDPVSENVTAVSYKLALVPLDPERTVYARASMVIVGRTGAMEIRSVNLSRRYSPVSEGGRDFADRLPEGIAMVAGLKQQGIRLVSHNSRIRVALGYGEEEFARKLRKNIFFMLTGDDQVRLSDAFCDPKDDRMVTLEIHPRRKDKSIFRCEVRGSLFHVEDGVPMSVLVFRDVTEIADRLQSAEEQLEGLKLDSGRQIRRLTEDNESLENRIILERESAVSAVKKESEEELERIRTESEQAMEKLRSESEETIAKLKDENSARLDETRLLAEKEMQETRMLAEREVEETRMLAEQEVEDIRRAAAEAHDILEAAFDCSPGETAVLLSSDGKTGRMMVHSRDLGSLLGLSEEELGAALERDLFTGFDISGVTRDILFRDAVMGSAAKGREFTLHRPDGSTSTVRFVLRREAVPEDAVLPAGFPGKAPEPEDGRDAGAGDASKEGGKKDPLFYVFLTYLDVTEDAAARAAAAKKAKEKEDELKEKLSREKKERAEGEKAAAEREENLAAERNALRDALEENSATEEERRAALEAQIDDIRAEKTEFLNRVHSDMLKPLEAIIALNDRLEEKRGAGSEERSLTEQIRESAVYMAERIEDMMGIAAPERAKASLKEMDFVFADFIGEVAEEAGKSCGRAGLSFDVFLDPGVPEVLRGDPEAIRRVLKAIVENAVRFTPRGGSVRLEVSSAQAENGYAPLKIVVSDTGIGIDDGLLPRLFEPFVRGEETPEGVNPGLGLGLAVASEFIRAMGGSIGVSSTPGKGSSFSLRLSLFIPLDEKGRRISALTSKSPESGSGKIIRGVFGQAGRPEAGTEKKQGKAFEGKRALLADADPIGTTDMTALLTEMGLAVETAGTGLGAVTLTERSSAGYYDVIFLDFSLPGMDGLETARRVRAVRPDTPVILLTRSAFEEDMAQASAAANGGIPKPVKKETLLTALTRVL